MIEKGIIEEAELEGFIKEVDAEGGGAIANSRSSLIPVA